MFIGFTSFFSLQRGAIDFGDSMENFPRKAFNGSAKAMAIGAINI